VAGTGVGGLALSSAARVAAGTALIDTGVFAALFDRFEALLEEPRDSWLRSVRQAAFTWFGSHGFPTTRDEEWRHTNVAAIARAPFAPSPVGRVGAATIQPLLFSGAAPIPCFVFVNGRFVDELSSPAESAGVRVRSLREGLAGDAGGLSADLTRIAPAEHSAFTSLNTAFLEDGAVVEIAARAVVEAPIHLIFFSTNPGGEAPSVSHPRVLVRAGAGSQAVLVETYAGPEGESYLTNAVTEVLLQERASLDRYKVERESDAAFHVGHVSARQERGSHFGDHSLLLGGGLVRNDVDVLFAGEGGECNLSGLLLGEGRQLLDAHTRVDHAQPHCLSRQTYKGVFDGRSQGVFDGLVLVRAGAQKTDAHQTNKNLLLSPQAMAHSTPRLRIHADDVKCKHGSTTGQLDPLQLFYLRSRGLGAAEARGLLTYAFASDVVSRIRVPGVRAGIEALLHARLPGAPEEVVA